MSQAPMDFEYDTMEEALQAAEDYTVVFGYEVTKPLQVDDKYCIRVSF